MDSVETDEEKKNIHHIPFSVLESKIFHLGMFTFIKTNDYIEVLNNDKLLGTYNQEDIVELISWLIVNCNNVDDIEFFKETSELEGINEIS